MKKHSFLLILILLFSCSEDDNNTNSNIENGFFVNSIFYPTPEFITGAITERPDRGFDIYEFYFKSGNENFIHLDVNSPNLQNLEEMNYPILNEDGRSPGISLLRKNGFDYPNINDDYYYEASTNYKDGFIKITQENGKLVFEYEFNYFDQTKSIKGYAKQP